MKKPRVLVLIVAYNASRTIEQVLSRIPPALGRDYEAEILIIDDASGDETFELSEQAKRKRAVPFPLHVLYNPVNQGYGGNQKIGFHYALEQGFDFVALVHGDGQYAPERLPELLTPLAAGEADVVLGSRMMTAGAARKGGMPLYKYVGNKILTWIQNHLLRTSLSEFHSGYRIYSVAALKRIPFQLNTKVFHFDTEILIQLVTAGARIKEVPIPTYYGDEICHVNGLKYARDVVLASLKARAQELSLFYDPKFDCAAPGPDNGHYQLKLGYESPHAVTLEKVTPGSRVLDLGCAGGYMGVELRRRGCKVTGVDCFPLGNDVVLDAFIHHDLNVPGLPVSGGAFDYVLMLDVIEHLLSPDRFVEQLRELLRFNPAARIVVSTGNIAFAPTRVMLLAGQFNYGKRGILDLTHTRLFTFSTLRRLFEQNGFEVEDMRGIPAPFPLAVGDNWVGRGLVHVNQFVIRLSRSLFAYQIFAVIHPQPSLDYLLAHASEQSAQRADALAS
jgi:glycosyltransferase involved in cell wall biosynthesis